jgi:hypothetical protein
VQTRTPYITAAPLTMEMPPLLNSSDRGIEPAS